MGKTNCWGLRQRVVAAVVAVPVVVVKVGALAIAIAVITYLPAKVSCSVQHRTNECRGTFIEPQID